MLGTVAEAFRVAAEDEALSRRLARTQTSCSLRVTDADRGLTVWLDREPIEVLEEPQDGTESEIHGCESDWIPVLAGDVHLGMALARGRLTWTGPVRKVLSIVPVLRSVYADVVRDQASAGEGKIDGESRGDEAA